jgi:hypothetical protein
VVPRLHPNHCLVLLLLPLLLLLFLPPHQWGTCRAQGHWRRSAMASRRARRGGRGLGSGAARSFCADDVVQWLARGAKKGYEAVWSLTSKLLVPQAAYTEPSRGSHQYRATHRNCKEGLELSSRWLSLGYRKGPRLGPGGTIQG